MDDMSVASHSPMEAMSVVLDSPTECGWDDEASALFPLGLCPDLCVYPPTHGRVQALFSSP